MFNFNSFGLLLTVACPCLMGLQSDVGGVHVTETLSYKFEEEHNLVSKY